MAAADDSGGFSGAASGGQLEERVDLAEETTEKLKQSQLLVDNGQLREALNLLSALEKRCRVGNDNASLIRVCEASLQYCYDVDKTDHEILISTLQTLATRRSQKTQAVKALIHKALPWVIKEKEQYTPLDVSGAGPEAKVFRDKLLDAMRDITDGKIFLELESARLTRALAIVKEEEGDISGAADILQEVHVETYGSLSKRDKIEFILEQIRLTLGKKDYVRAAIVASKISRKHLVEENMEEYKVKFFTLMTIYHKHKKQTFELAKDYHSIYSTPSILKKDDEWKLALQNTVLFLALSPYSMEQQNMMNVINTDANLEKLPDCQKTIQLLLKKEIINFPLPNQKEIESWPAFKEGMGEDISSIEESKDESSGSRMHELLHKRIIQHNIRIASLYYTRIKGNRLAELLNLKPKQLELEIASMVSDRSVYAKIDRPKDIIRFSISKSPEAVLSDWAADIDKLLHLVETTTHLINKENMTNTNTASSSGAAATST